MDGLSLVASIIAVIQVTTAVTKQAYDYANCVKNATKEIENIDSQLKDLKNVLTKLKDLADQAAKSGQSLDSWPTLASLDKADGPLAECRLAMASLSAELASVDGLAKYAKRALWPRKKKKVEKCLNNIEKQKEIFIESLNVEHMYEATTQCGIASLTWCKRIIYEYRAHSFSVV